MDKHIIFGAPYRLTLTSGESIEGTVLKREEQSLEVEIKSEQRTIKLEEIQSADLILFGPGQ